jgi:hypothetical protein
MPDAMSGKAMHFSVRMIPPNDKANLPRRLVSR